MNDCSGLEVKACVSVIHGGYALVCVRIVLVRKCMCVCVRVRMCLRVSVCVRIVGARGCACGCVAVCVFFLRVPMCVVMCSSLSSLEPALSLWSSDSVCPSQGHAFSLPATSATPVTPASPLSAPLGTTFTRLIAKGGTKHLRLAIHTHKHAQTCTHMYTVVCVRIHK